MAYPRDNPKGRMGRLARHLAILPVLLATAIALATWSGQLWPFDLRFSALIAGGGLVVLALAWWPAALALALVAGAALLPRIGMRLALWPLAVIAMAGLHAEFGPDLGFMPAADLGVTGFLRLYAIPVALPILAGSALRAALGPRRKPASHPLNNNPLEKQENLT